MKESTKWLVSGLAMVCIGVILLTIAITSCTNQMIDNGGLKKVVNIIWEGEKK